MKFISHRGNLKGPSTYENTRKQITKVLGSDGFISPDNWMKAKKAWIAQGLNVEEFEGRFSSYKNTS